MIVNGDRPIIPSLREITCGDMTCIQNALQTALPGDRILISPGTYTGEKSTSGNSSAFFYSDRNGTTTNRIVLESADLNNQAILEGTATDIGRVFYLLGDYWDVRNLRFRTAKKGIMLDGVSYATFENIEVSNVGEEGIHLRSGSSNNIITHSNVHDVGLLGGVSAGFGECIYVGSDINRWLQFNPASDNNVISYNILRNCTAEAIDVKEGVTGTQIIGNTFDGTGISGTNGADSFINVKGNNTVIVGNVGNQNGNALITNAFEVHTALGTSGWCNNSDFSYNVVNMASTLPPPYFLWVQSGCTGTLSHANTRSPDDNLHSGPVTLY